MSPLRHSFSRRDVILLLVGAVLMHLYSISFLSSSDIVINTHLHDSDRDQHKTITHKSTVTTTVLSTTTVTARGPETTQSQDIAVSYPDYPQTWIVDHAPGWTLFRNLYMSNGTFFILSSNQSFPEFRMMTSTSLWATGEADNIQSREPTNYSMAYISPDQVRTQWDRRIYTVPGNTVLVNEPHQFLRHYYHLVAELFLGIQAFWHGAFSKPSTTEQSALSLTHPAPPPIDRVIFAYSNADGWRDNPGFDRYFVRAAYPGLTVEHREDWEDRIHVTSSLDRAYHFPLLLLTDRSASFRGAICGSQTQRIAAEAIEYMKKEHKLLGEKVGGWWEPVRAAVLRFAGLVPASDMPIYKNERLPNPEKPVITYISRQGSGRRLTEEGHSSLVDALNELEKKRQWEVNILRMEDLTKDQQLSYASRTTVLLGVHGNGLSHLIFMPPTRVSAVLEMFYPQGFAHDYQWTTHALGMRHWAIWNDTSHTLPNKPPVNYPEGFQGNQIPAHGPSITNLIESIIDGVI